ncbi:uncharacterized protein VTP21DRAFT_10572 [Calcarisporiella thermophila]|uniref:uncharacterized protein n=1 Tax=Calcarisporiella thermophila TaxID=911321 RepID=UPI00374298A8
MNSQQSTQFVYKKATEFENQLKKLYQAKKFFDKDTTIVRLSLRDTYLKIIFQDFEFAISKELEQNLWRYVYYKVFEEYRRLLKAVSDTSRAKSIEDRRILSSFRSFVQDATSFYQSFISRLAAHFDLEKVHPYVQKFGSSDSDPQGRLPITKGAEVNAPEPVKQRALLSCHKSLIFLGDLARYREQFSDRPRKNFSNACEYYNQAHQLLPESGNPFNQLACIDSYHGDDFAALYHYFRSLTVKFPFTNARENVLLLFRKMEKLSSGEVANGTNQAKQKRLLVDIARLCGKSYMKTDEEGFLELKQRVLPDFKAGIASKLISSDQIVMTLALYMSSLHLLSHGIRDPTKPQQSKDAKIPRKGDTEWRAFILILEFFIQMFGLANDDISSMALQQPGNKSATFASIAQLPALRLASLWLVSHEAYIRTMASYGAEKNASDLNTIDKLWETYAIFASRVCESFPNVNADTESTHPPLKEDIEFYGFIPLDIEIDEVYAASAKKLDSMKETLVRLADIVQMAVKFTEKESPFLFVTKNPVSNAMVFSTKSPALKHPPTAALVDSSDSSIDPLLKCAGIAHLVDHDEENDEDVLSLIKRPEQVCEEAEGDDEVILFTGKHQPPANTPSMPTQTVSGLLPPSAPASWISAAAAAKRSSANPTSVESLVNQVLTGGMSLRDNSNDSDMSARTIEGGWSSFSAGSSLYPQQPSLPLPQAVQGTNAFERSSGMFGQFSAPQQQPQYSGVASGHGAHITNDSLFGSGHPSSPHMTLGYPQVPNLRSSFGSDMTMNGLSAPFGAQDSYTSPRPPHPTFSNHPLSQGPLNGHIPLGSAAYAGNPQRLHPFFAGPNSNEPPSMTNTSPHASFVMGQPQTLLEQRQPQQYQQIPVSSSFSYGFSGAFGEASTKDSLRSFGGDRGEGDNARNLIGRSSSITSSTVTPSGQLFSGGSLFSQSTMGTGLPAQNPWARHPNANPM